MQVFEAILQRERAAAAPRGEAARGGNAADGTACGLNGGPC